MATSKKSSKSGSTSRASKLSPKTNAKRNTKSGRAKLPASDFGLPKQRKYRIDDAAHARNALARVAQFGTPEEKRKVREAVHEKFPNIEVSGLPKRSSKSK